MGSPIAQDGQQLLAIATLVPQPLAAVYTGASTAQQTASLTPDADKTAYVTGFEITGLGATAGTNIIVTLGPISNKGASVTFSYELSVVAGATTINPALVVEFPYPMPAPAKNTAITLTIPAFGAGNTQINANLHGFAA